MVMCLFFLEYLIGLLWGFIYYPGKNKNVIGFPMFLKILRQLTWPFIMLIFHLWGIL